MYSLSAYSTNLTGLVVPATIPFNNILSQSGNSNCNCGDNFSAGGTNVSLNKPGTYRVTVNADILGTAAGIVALQLLNNNVAVPGALASVTTAAGTTYNAGFSTIIKVNRSCACQNNNANLQVQLQTTTATLSNVNITVQRIC